MRFPASESLSESSLLTATFLLPTAAFLAAGAGEFSQSLDVAGFVAVLFLAAAGLDSESRIDGCLTSTQTISVLMVLIYNTTIT